jgi:hypothetical protein
MDTSKIEHYIKLGAHDKDWYERCENVLVQLFGRDQLVTVANLFAATSINSSLKSNVALFRKAYRELMDGKPFSNYLPNIKDQLEKIRAGQPITGNKINAFARAMSGGADAVVVDVWLLRAFGMDKKYRRHSGVHATQLRSSGATTKQYREIEEWVRSKAYDMGIEPRQLSAMIWSGVRLDHNPKDKVTHYENVIKRGIQKEFNFV